LHKYLEKRLKQKEITSSVDEIDEIGFNVNNE
jgi:hypothetical protein